MTTEQRDEQLARDALLEVTSAESVGPLSGREQADDGVVTLTFAATMPGYPGWHWTVGLAEVEGLEPTVLEVELMPGEGALLAPEWVPWSVRLDEYRAAQAAAGEFDESADADAVTEADDDGDEVDLDDDDADLDDDLGDDPDDGIDFESHVAEPGELADPELGSGLTEMGDDEEDEADAESDEDRPEPPAAVRRQQRRKKQQ
jgi:hypothetical protein